DAVDDERPVGVERVGAVDRPADDDGAEAAHIAQLGLPRHERLQLTLALKLEPVDRLLGDDQELREVDRVHALAEDRALAAALAYLGLALGAGLPPGEERTRVLEVVAGDHLAERLAGQKGLAVAGVDVADLTLRDGDEGHLVDAELPPPEAEVKAAAEDLGL